MTMNVYNDVREVARIGWGGEDFLPKLIGPKKVKKLPKLPAGGEGGYFGQSSKERKRKLHDYGWTHCSPVTEKVSLTSLILIGQHFRDLEKIALASLVTKILY